MGYMTDSGVYDVLATSDTMGAAGGIISTQRAPTDPIFQTNLKLVSLQLDSAYAILDKDDALITSGSMSASPTYFNGVQAYTDTDPVTIYFLKFGYKFKESGFVLVNVQTLLFMAQDVNPFVVETNTATIAAWENDKITIAGTVVTLNNVEPQEIYDFFQYWQSLPANAGTLAGGEIYSTTDGDNFTGRSDYSFVNSNIDTIYVAVSAVSKEGLDVIGTNGLYTYSKSFLTFNDLLNTKSGTTELDDKWWELALDVIGLNYVIHVYEDGSTDLDQKPTLANWTTLATAKLVITAPVGHRHKGISTQGASIRSKNTAQTKFFMVNENVNMHFELSHLRLIARANGNFPVYQPGPNTVLDSIYFIWESGESTAVYSIDNAVVKNCVAVNFLYGGFNMRNAQSNYKVTNCVAYNCPGGGFMSANMQDLIGFGNNIAINCGDGITTFNYKLTPSIAGAFDLLELNCADNDGSAPGTTNVTLTAQQVLDEFENAAGLDFHLKQSSTILLGGGLDFTSVNSNDIDGNPWELPMSIGVDQVGDILFASYLQLVSIQLDIPYYIQDKDDIGIGSGFLTASPLNLGTPVLASSLEDAISITFLKYGYKYRKSTFVLTEGSTLMFMANDVNPYITETDAAVVAAYSPGKISISGQIVTLNNAEPEEIYDYFQYYQSLAANAATLVGGEIYSTTDGLTYSPRSDWNFVLNNIDTIYVCISAGAYVDDDYVPGSNGTRKYSKVFSSFAAMYSDAEYGRGGTELVDKHVIYEFSNEQVWTCTGGISFAGWVRSSLTTVTFKPVYGQSHKGIWGNGARIQLTNSYDDINQYDHCFVIGMEIYFSNATSTDYRMNYGYIYQTMIQGSPLIIGFAGTVKNSVLLGGVSRSDYGGGKFYNNYIAAMGVSTTGSTNGAFTFKNNIIHYTSLPSTVPTPNDVENNAYTGTPPAAWQGAGDIYNIDREVEMVDPLGVTYDCHLKNASQLVGAGMDLSSLGVDVDIDGNPWLDDNGNPFYNIGPDMLGEVVFATYLNLSSTDTGFAYAVEDLNHDLFSSGELTANPLVLGSPLLANSLEDAIYVYHLYFGYIYKSSTFVAKEGSTSIFMALETQTNLTETDPVTVAAYTGIAVDFVTSTVTISATHTQAEVYDYLQYQQSLIANSAYLPIGEILNTVLGNTYNINPNWTLNFTAAPSGSWNLQGGSVVIGAEFDVSDFDYSGTLLFDVAGSYTFTNCEINAVDTVDGDETISYTPAGTSNTPTNNDVTNITINVPPVAVQIVVKDAGTLETVQGAMIYLACDAGGPAAEGTVIFKELSDVDGSVENLAYVFAGDQPITGRVRKGTSGVTYSTGQISGAITASGFSTTVFLVRD
jgi:hypothetical protein